jgi:hypothetical protein
MKPPVLSSPNNSSQEDCSRRIISSTPVTFLPSLYSPRHPNPDYREIPAALSSNSTTSNSTSTVVADDSGIKFTNKDDVKHLIAAVKDSTTAFKNKPEIKISYDNIKNDDNHDDDHINDDDDDDDSIVI